PHQQGRRPPDGPHVVPADVVILATVGRRVRGPDERHPEGRVLQDAKRRRGDLAGYPGCAGRPRDRDRHDQGPARPGRDRVGRGTIRRRSGRRGPDRRVPPLGPAVGAGYRTGPVRPAAGPKTPEPRRGPGVSQRHRGAHLPAAAHLRRQAIRSLDGYVATQDNTIERSFDWLQNSEVEIPTPARTSSST